MRAYLMQIPEFQKAEYVEITPLTGPARRFRRWAGFNWIFHPHLPGVGTTAEQCFAFHRNAVGHAVNTGEMDVRAGYNEERLLLGALLDLHGQRLAAELRCRRGQP
jgi:hypothetical protein